MASPAAQISLRELRFDELGDAAQLLARGMRDNPINVRAFGQDAEHRRRALGRFFGPVLRGAHRRGAIFGAFRNGALVGVSVEASPGRCQPTPFEKLNVLPTVLFGNPLGTSLRVLSWVGEWSRWDPKEAHWHLGPVAVDSQLRGQGIGGAMMADFCARMDGRGAVAYLETDKAENIRFYERFGFTVRAKADVLGLPNWFMSRPGLPR